MKAKQFSIYKLSLIILCAVFIYLVYWLSTIRQSPVPIVHFNIPEQIEPSQKAEIIHALLDSKAAIISQQTNAKKAILSRLLGLDGSKLPNHISAPIPTNHALKENVPMDDPDLIETIRKELIPPSKKPYNFEISSNNESDANPSAGQIQALQHFFENYGQNGFYIECGANDGEHISNSLWLEKSLNWDGLLIEADPTAFSKLKTKNRKAWLGGFCLSDTPYAKNTSYYLQISSDRFGSGLIRSEYYNAKQSVPSQCFPLYSVLLTLNRTTVDFFSLDVEGSEMEILKTIPFDKILIKIMAVEHILLREGKMGLRKFLEEKGFTFYRTVTQTDSGDSIFIHKSIQLSDEQKIRIGVEDSDVEGEPRMNS